MWIVDIVWFGKIKCSKVICKIGDDDTHLACCDNVISIHMIDKSGGWDGNLRWFIGNWDEPILE